MSKSFLIAWIAAFIVWMAGSFVIHGVLLKPDYSALSISCCSRMC
jgi:predicted membrane protein